MTDDLRNRLDHLSDRLSDVSPSDAFDRLDRARHRRNRSRKIGALVALLVAVGGTATAVIAFDDDEGSRVAGHPSPTSAPWTAPGVLTVWPENPIRGGDPLEDQAAADAGDEGLAWRIDPHKVAERFASTVLGWSELTAIERDVEIDPSLGSWSTTSAPVCPTRSAISSSPCRRCGSCNLSRREAAGSGASRR